MTRRQARLAGAAFVALALAVMAPATYLGVRELRSDRTDRPPVPLRDPVLDTALRRGVIDGYTVVDVGDASTRYRVDRGSLEVLYRTDPGDRRVLIFYSGPALAQADAIRSLVRARTRAPVTLTPLTAG